MRPTTRREHAGTQNLISRENPAGHAYHPVAAGGHWAPVGRRGTNDRIRGDAPVSPLSCWEISTFARQERVALDREPAAWIGRLFGESRVALVPLSTEAAVWAGILDRLTLPGDPIGRLIYASAHDVRVPLVTKVEKLRAYAARARDIDVVW